MLWLVLLLLLRAVPRATAVNATHIVVGVTAPVATAARALAGLNVALLEANDAGGAISRNFTLVVLDDGNNATTAINNIHTLNNTYDTFVLAATWGNDMFTAILPTMVQTRIPLVGPFAGPANTHSPFQDVVVNLRPSYADEIVAQSRFLVEYLRVQRIAAFYTNDALGLGGFTTLVQALGAVGVSLVNSVMYTGNMTDALEALLSQPQKPQSVVMVSSDVEVSQFVPTYRLDPRADPNCTFLYSSLASTATVGAKNLPYAYFTRTVPPTYGDTNIAQRFRLAASKYQMPSNYLSGQYAFEGYIVGRLIVAVTLGLSRSRLNREAFLDEVYNTRLYYLDDVAVGLFGRNTSGCVSSICNCNSGMRRVWIAALDPVTLTLSTNASWPVTQYPITQCAAPTTIIRRPILFGQLIPTDDPAFASFARDVTGGVRLAFAELNAAGGLNGRQYGLVTQEYSGDPARAVAALLDRWPLVALLGSVVANGVTLPSGIPRIGTVDMTPWPFEAPFMFADVRIRPSTPLEMMTLASFLAEQMGTTAHLRVRRSSLSAGQLAALTKSLNTFQAVPASSVEFDSAVAAFDGLTDGYVIVIGTTQDILDWISLLQDRPALTLLTFRGVILGPMSLNLVNRSSPLMNQILFASEVQVDQTSNYSQIPPQSKYGYLAGTLVGKVLSQSPITASSAHTTPDDMINAWYDVQTIKIGNTVLGPYYSDNCSYAGDMQCECNLGARTLAVVTPSPNPIVRYRYQTSTCTVVYKPLQLVSPAAASIVLPVVLGVVLGTAGVLVVVVGVVVLGRRNNRAAPKDSAKPFAVIFTDIQASTALWATVPNDMAPALDAHHCLIRRLIRKYHCYEVKTIGDSFMCAHKSPIQALRFALAVQETFFKYDWGTTAIDTAYEAMLNERPKVPRCWNGLRVRVGIHYGYGDVRRDPVSHGYDYYGTLVNTAARIESVCHGGQVCISEAVYKAVDGHVSGCDWTELGPHMLRGLSEPVFLYQVLPDGYLANRKFPPLRIERFDAREEVLEDGNDSDTDVERADPTPNRPKNSVVPSSESTWIHDKWAEVHPLVVKGEATPEELRRHYAILQTGLSAMLASQLKAAKREMLRQLCDRLHVANHGSEGPQLLRTLHGLISRVLPATIAQQAAREGRRGSLHSRLSSAPESPSPNGRAASLHPHSPLSQPKSPGQMYTVDSPHACLPSP
eukprot:EG_transcript_481